MGNTITDARRLAECITEEENYKRDIPFRRCTRCAGFHDLGLCRATPTGEGQQPVAAVSDLFPSARRAANERGIPDDAQLYAVPQATGEGQQPVAGEIRAWEAREVDQWGNWTEWSQCRLGLKPQATRQVRPLYAAPPQAAQAGPEGMKWAINYWQDRALKAEAKLAAQAQTGEPYHLSTDEQAALRRVAQRTFKPVAAQAQTGEARLPKLTAKMIRAACDAHYGKCRVEANGGPNGIAMTVDGVNYSFTQAFRRMWAGVRESLAAPADRNEGGPT